MEIYYYFYNILKVILCTGLSAILLSSYNINKGLSVLVALLIFFIPFKVAIFFTFIILIALIDQKYFKISNTLVLTATIIAFVLSNNFYHSLLSGIIFSLPLLILYIASQVMEKHMIGAGDVKLLFTIGVFVSSIKLLPLLYILSIIGLLPYFFMGSVIPLGPPLAFATYMIYIFKVLFI